MLIKPSAWCPGRNSHPLWRGCIGYWPFWAGAGDRAFDISGNANHGTLKNMVPASDWLPTTRGMALDFDGVNDYVELGNIDILDGVVNFTLSMWVNHTSLTTDDDLFVIGQHTGSAPFLLWRDEATPDHYAFVLSDDSDSTLQYSAYVPQQNIWTHVVLVFRGGSETRMYINGLEDAASPWNTSAVDFVKTSVFNYRIGNDSTLAKAFGGLIAEPAIWNRALSASEGREIYEDPFCMIRPDDFGAFYDAVIPGFIPYPYPRGLRGGHGVMSGGLI